MRTLHLIKIKDALTFTHHSANGSKENAGLPV